MSLPAGRWGGTRPVLVALRPAGDARDRARGPAAQAASPSLALAPPARLSRPTGSSTGVSPLASRSTVPPAVPVLAPAADATGDGLAAPTALHGIDASTARPEVQTTNLRIPSAQTLVYGLTGRSRGQPFQGEAELDWRHDGHQYEAHMRQRWATGLREMSSTGRLGTEGLAPEQFTERHQGRGELAAHFEPATGSGLAAPALSGRGREGGARVRFSGNQPDAELPAGAQDRLSVFLQLAARVAGLGRPLRAGETLDFPVATARAGAAWRFRYEGAHRLPGPGGERDALRLRRQPEAPHDLEIEVWLAPDLDYLPLQWRLSQDNGDWFEQRWTGDYRP